MISLTKKVAILSIHDISPPFFKEILEIHKMLETLDINSFSALITPYYLNEKKNDIRNHKHMFNEIIRDGEPVQHGFTHETTAYTNEYSLLNRDKIHDRIVQGKKLLQMVSRKAIDGFIPPKWILTKNLLSVLLQEQFKYTTSFLRIIPFGHQVIICPVINFLYTYSRINTQFAMISYRYALSRLKKGKLIRIALHPEGFAVRRHLITSVLKQAIQFGYDFTTYGDYLNHIMNQN